MGVGVGVGSGSGSGSTKVTSSSVVTVGAGAQTSLPSWSAVTTQRPVERMVMSAASTVQTASSTDAQTISSPEVAVADAV